MSKPPDRVRAGIPDSQDTHLPGHAQLAAAVPPGLRQRVEGRQWYHTIELAPGLATPGFFDHRSVAPKILPRTLTGLRCLDVATFDGFWAIEMTIRGANEVVAVDVPDPGSWDWPVGSEEAAIAAISARRGAGDGFSIAMEALGYEIERVECSAYDLDPTDIGQFDFVYVGSLLLHLRDPVRALERIRTVCRGELLLVENVDPLMTMMHPRHAAATLDGLGRPWWWRLNLAGVERVALAAGFDVIETPKRLRFPRGRGRATPPVRFSTIRNPATRRELRETILGDSHAILRARPRPGL